MGNTCGARGTIENLKRRLSSARLKLHDTEVENNALRNQLVDEQEKNARLLESKGQSNANGNQNHGQADTDDMEISEMEEKLRRKKQERAEREKAAENLIEEEDSEKTPDEKERETEFKEKAEQEETIALKKDPSFQDLSAYFPKEMYSARAGADSVPHLDDELNSETSSIMSDADQLEEDEEAEDGSRVAPLDKRVKSGSKGAARRGNHSSDQGRKPAKLRRTSLLERPVHGPYKNSSEAQQQQLDEARKRLPDSFSDSDMARGKKEQLPTHVEYPKRAQCYFETSGTQRNTSRSVSAMSKSWSSLSTSSKSSTKTRSWPADDPWRRVEEYHPKDFTHEEVMANSETWAHPDDFTHETVQTYLKQLKHSGELLHYKGEKPENPPLNPSGRTGIKGRGLLGKWGPNFAVDPLITRFNKREGRIEVALIQRKDVERNDEKHKWALPGAFLQENEQVNDVVRRRFLQEACGLGANDVEPEGDFAGLTKQERDDLFHENNSRGVVFRGPVEHDPRVTDNAWIETTAVHFHLSEEHAKKLKLSANLELVKDAKWVAADDSGSELGKRTMYADHRRIVLTCVSKLISERAITLDFLQRFIKFQKRKYGMGQEEVLTSHKAKCGPGKQHSKEDATPHEWSIKGLTQKHKVSFVSWLYSDDALKEVKDALLGDSNVTGKPKAEPEAEAEAEAEAEVEAEAERGSEVEAVLDWCGPADAFVSYPWQVPLSHVWSALRCDETQRKSNAEFRKLVEARDREGAKKLKFWMDIFTVNQHSIDTPTELQKLDVVVQSCPFTLSVLEPLIYESNPGRISVPLAVKRAWMCLEIGHALEHRNCQLVMALREETWKQLTNLAESCILVEKPEEQQLKGQQVSSKRKPIRIPRRKKPTKQEVDVGEIVKKKLEESFLYALDQIDVGECKAYYEKDERMILKRLRNGIGINNVNESIRMGLSMVFAEKIQAIAAEKEESLAVADALFKGLLDRFDASMKKREEEGEEEVSPFVRMQYILIASKMARVLYREDRVEQSLEILKDASVKASRILEALEDLPEMTKYKKDIGEVYNSLGRSLSKLGRDGAPGKFAEAMKLYGEALEEGYITQHESKKKKGEILYNRARSIIVKIELCKGKREDHIQDLKIAKQDLDDSEKSQKETCEVPQFDENGRIDPTSVSRDYAFLGSLWVFKGKYFSISNKHAIAVEYFKRGLSTQEDILGEFSLNPALTKLDFGRHYFENAMYFASAERFGDSLQTMRQTWVKIRAANVQKMKEAMILFAASAYFREAESGQTGNAEAKNRGQSRVSRELDLFEDRHYPAEAIKESRRLTDALFEKSHLLKRGIHPQACIEIVHDSLSKT